MHLQPRSAFTFKVSFSKPNPRYFTSSLSTLNTWNLHSFCCTHLPISLYGKRSKVRVKSVDSSQGSESPVVILSTTRPGGNYGLGFLSDRKRACVALSRAQSYLVIVGYKKMGDGLQAGASQGFLVWQRLVNQHRQTSTLCHVKGTSSLIQEHLGISEGRAGYERARRSWGRGDGQWRFNGILPSIIWLAVSSSVERGGDFSGMRRSKVVLLLVLTLAFIRPT